MNCFACCLTAETDETTEISVKKGEEKKDGANLASLVDNMSFKSGKFLFILFVFLAKQEIDFIEGQLNFLRILKNIILSKWAKIKITKLKTRKWQSNNLSLRGEKN